jgi:molecular chaperone DnaK (HSP70)
VRQLVKDFFNGKEPRVDINADEVVAYGAAVVCAKLKADRDCHITATADVVPLSLGALTPIDDASALPAAHDEL